MGAKEILKQHQLKRTSCREGIIEVMLKADHPLSETEIRELLAGNYDRTTFYRSFITLEESRIIHRIVVDQQTVKYALDYSITHKQEHPHFFCQVCHDVKCLEAIPLQEFVLPQGFTKINTDIVIKGTRPNCQQNPNAI